jgi:hypothetical protein
VPHRDGNIPDTVGTKRREVPREQGFAAEFQKNLGLGKADAMPDTRREDDCGRRLGLQ